MFSLTGFKDSISNVRKKRFHTKVELGDNGTYAIEGIGSTSLKLESGWSLHLEEVLYVPGLKKNLLSVGVLEDKGYNVAFTKGKAIMWPSGGDMSSAIEIGVKEGNVYRLTRNPIQAQVHVVMNPCELWHRRFGHLNYCSLPSLPDTVTGMPPIKLVHDGMCKGCALGKNVKKPYSGSSRRSTGILDLIHFDLCGLMTAPSMSGCLYYVIFIDDYSRKT